MTQLGIDICGPQRNEALSQFFTPPDLALRMWNTSRVCNPSRILEPSAGLGALIKPILRPVDDRGESMAEPAEHIVDAIDLDPRNIAWLRENLASPGVNYECCDYLTRPAPTQLYDLSISNVPYNEGDDGLALDGPFLSKLMDECERITTLIRLTSLCGDNRWNSVWTRCHGEYAPWVVRTCSPLPRRPNCGGKGGQIDFCVVKMSRRKDTDERFAGCLDWWLM